MTEGPFASGKHGVPEASTETERMQFATIEVSETALNGIILVNGILFQFRIAHNPDTTTRYLLCWHFVALTSIANNASPATITEDGKAKTTAYKQKAYELVYTVRLKDNMYESSATQINKSKTQVDGQYKYKVNESATLNYISTDTKESQSETFPIPTVMGLNYNIEFLKTDENTNQPISGVTIQLKDSAKKKSSKRQVMMEKKIYRLICWNL